MLEERESFESHRLSSGDESKCVEDANEHCRDSDDDDEEEDDELPTVIEDAVLSRESSIASS